MAQWQYTPYLIPMLVAVGISLALSVQAWRQRAAPGATPFFWLMLLVTEWSLGYALELACHDPSTKLFLINVQYVAIVSSPLLWLVFALDYTGRQGWLTRRRLALMSLVPSVTLLLTWTNEVHGLFMSQRSFYQDGSLLLTDWTAAPWFWVHTAYSYLLLFLGTILLVRAIVRSSQLYRWQAATLLVGILIPWMESVLYVLRLSPLPGLNLRPLMTTLTGLVIGRGLLRYRLFDLIPVARDAVIEGMSDGMIVLDPQGRIVDLNLAAQSILDVPVAQAIGRSAAQFLSPWTDWVERLQAGQGGRAEITLGQDDMQRHYDLRISSLQDRRGRSTGWLMVLRDVTQRVQAESQRDVTLETLRRRTVELEASNRELDAFARTAAHDLKNPLAWIVGYADLLEEDHTAMPAAELRQRLGMIAKSGRKMSAIIDELLLLSSVRQAEAIETHPLDMADIVAQVRERLAPMIEEYQAEIILPASEAWPVAIGYGPWIEEVWVNYLVNALKYGGRPPRIELGCGELAHRPARETSTRLQQPATRSIEVWQIRFWVRDNGPGIPPEDQARLFTPFTRLDHVRAKGHGLGLSIVRRIVERLGGQVGVESMPGQGSVFTFTLPAAKS